MLALISPAKKLNYDFDPFVKNHSQPDFLPEAQNLVTTARQLSRRKLAQTMNLSDSLAELNWQRFQSFSPPFDLDNARQAALVFAGDTYIGLDAHSLSKKDLEFAQSRLRILSGLYGLLRPLDLIQPYRLEMGARFKPARKTDLYDFWDRQITDAINEAVAGHKEDTVINLASNEYFKSVKKAGLNGRLLTMAFKEVKDGQTRMIGTFAKQARGMMARFMIQNRVEKSEDLKKFDTAGYRFQAELSDDNTLTFTRPQPPSPKAAAKASKGK